MLLRISNLKHDFVVDCRAAATSSGHRPGRSIASYQSGGAVKVAWRFSVELSGTVTPRVNLSLEYNLQAAKTRRGGESNRTDVIAGGLRRISHETVGWVKQAVASVGLRSLFS